MQDKREIKVLSSQETENINVKIEKCEIQEENIKEKDES